MSLIFLYACEEEGVEVNDQMNELSTISDVEAEVYQQAKSASNVSTDSAVVIFCHYLGYPLTVVDEDEKEYVINNLEELSTNFPTDGNWWFKYPMYLETIPDRERVSVESEEALGKIKEDCKD